MTTDSFSPGPDGAEQPQGSQQDNLPQTFTWTARSSNPYHQVTPPPVNGFGTPLGLQDALDEVSSTHCSSPAAAQQLAEEQNPRGIFLQPEGFLASDTPSHHPAQCGEEWQVAAGT